MEATTPRYTSETKIHPYYNGKRRGENCLFLRVILKKIKNKDEM